MLFLTGPDGGRSSLGRSDGHECSIAACQAGKGFKGSKYGLYKQRIKLDAGSYEGFKGKQKRDQLSPEQTANGTDFTGVQVPEGAPTDLLCEECERRDAIGCCEDCGQVLCAVCLAIIHIPSTGGQAHAHLVQGGIRALRAWDESTVIREDEDSIPAHEIDEDQMATRRDLSVPSSFEAPTIDLSSRTAKRNAAEALHTKGQLVVFKAELADALPDHLADDEGDDCELQGHYNASSVWRSGSKPRELYGEVLSVPMARHGEWGHAARRAQGHRLLVRVRILGRATRGYSEPFVDEWLRHKLRREGPREPVKIIGGSGLDPRARSGCCKSQGLAPRRRPEDLSASRAGTTTNISVSNDNNDTNTGDGASRTNGKVDHRLNKVVAGDSGGGPQIDNSEIGGGVVGEDCGETGTAWVVLVAEENLFPVEVKREELRRSRCAIVATCCQSAKRRWKVNRTRAALWRWRDTAVDIRNERWEWASRMLQRRTRGTLMRIRRARQREVEEKALWEAGRRLHKQFCYLNTQELRDQAGGGVTTDGRVFLRTKAELNRLEAFRRVMAERCFRALCKGVYDVKVRAFKRWLIHTEWEKRANENYVFNIAMDVSLAGDAPVEAGPCKTDWRHPSHGIAMPLLPPVHSGRLITTSSQKDQPISSAAASVARAMVGPAPFCSWLMPGSVLISSYIDSEAKARPRQFKQPLYPDAASHILMAGIGTLVCLSSEETVRQHESDHELAMFDQAFGVSHKTISASIKTRVGEAKHEIMILRQEENNLELLRSVEGYDQDERRKALASIVTRMRAARRAYTAAKRDADLFPSELKVAWEPLPEDEAPTVEAVVELAVRLEKRLRNGEKLCLWSPRGHGRVGLVGAVLLGRLYGFTAEDALLRVQACHDARESVKGQPQISCPQTIAQVQCVREVLLQQAGIYTDLAIRADLPASKRGLKVCKCVRGKGPPSLRQAERVPDETQVERYKRERDSRLQMHTIQDEHQPDLLKSPLLAPPSPATAALLSNISSTRVVLGSSQYRVLTGAEVQGRLVKAATSSNNGICDVESGRDVLPQESL